MSKQNKYACGAVARQAYQRCAVVMNKKQPTLPMAPMGLMSVSPDDHHGLMTKMRNGGDSIENCFDKGYRAELKKVAAIENFLKMIATTGQPVVRTAMYASKNDKGKATTGCKSHRTINSRLCAEKRRCNTSPATAASRRTSTKRVCS